MKPKMLAVLLFSSAFALSACGYNEQQAQRGKRGQKLQLELSLKMPPSAVITWSLRQRHNRSRRTRDSCTGAVLLTQLLPCKRC